MPVACRPVAAAACALLCVAAPVSAQDWSGTYAGLSAGYTESDVDWTAMGTSLFVPPNAGYSSAENGSTYGLHLGQRFQRDNGLVLGWEVGVADLDHDRLAENPYTSGETFQTQFGPMLTVTGQIGQATGNWLVYAEAGLAWAERRVTNRAPYCAVGPCTLDLSTSRPGFVLGLGVDYKVSDQMSIGVSYRNTRFGSSEEAGTVSQIGFPEQLRIDGDASVVSLRLNWYFN
ncbi:outer membrane protein [Pararhodobacter zhoushanensis]|uniref:Porin family protein n=1 Tax=Pararhodobacter zhoushanensis TaxID=2479545 RepID=A0ABT3GYN5_9RHOB|nr:porin family protein [Pararhodobacter zhoushanensis]MCW1932675.1 porin family protein [Pararhodobacter zhoushanensis]